jgi:hypothetical protein
MAEAQRITRSKPLYVVTDKSEKYTSENEAFYLKNYRVTFNANADGSEGGNFGLGTPIRSNKKASIGVMPAGKNMTMGAYESKETNQIYYFNWNSNNFHGIYRINGDTLKWEIVMVDPILAFSNDPAHRIPPHRVTLRVYYENDPVTKTKKAKAIFLVFTDGFGWQRFIDTEAAVATNGYDASQYPYYTLRPPQFDRQEYIDLAIRPPMFPIEVSAIDPTADDIGKPNNITDKAIQFAAEFQNTDNRTSVFGPYSSPFIQKSNPCNLNASGLPRCLKLKINVGSALVERVLLYQRLCGGDWYLYDTIERFGPRSNTDQYWLRDGQWAGLNYDHTDNTIEYTYCGDKETSLAVQDDANRIQTDLPLVSIGLTAAGDSILLLDNLYNYNNFEKSELAKFSLAVQDTPSDVGSYSVVKTRKITLYAFLSTVGPFGQIDSNAFIWTNGSDTTLRYGGITTNFNNGGSIQGFAFNTQFNDYLGLTLGDSKNFICYLAGTPYYAEGKQGIIDKQGNFTELLSVNAQNNQQTDLLKTIHSQGKFVVQKFEFDVPAGKYIARMARQGVDLNTQYQKTSTSIIGLANKNNINAMFGLSNWAGVNNFVKEIEVDVCTEDFDAWTTNNSLFYLFVPYVFQQSGNAGVFNNLWRFIEGYLQEDDTSLQPYERATYIKKAGLGGLAQYERSGKITDHNGYYFEYMAMGTAYKGEVQFIGLVNCNGPNILAETAIHLNAKQDNGYYQENISVADFLGGPLGPCMQIKIRGTVLDCKTGAPIAGVGVTLTQGATAYTGIDGAFEIIAHDGNAAYQGRIYANVSGSCLMQTCAASCLDVQPYDSNIVGCNSCVERIYPATFNFSFTFADQNVNSIKEGGRYGVSVQGWDRAGRVQYANFIGYIDAPSFPQKGNFNPMQIVVNLLQDLILPNDLAYISFSVTKELTNKKYLHWVGDAISFLDKDGNILADGNGAVRAKISIQSLLDYNKQNNFSTTVEYQQVPGDFVRIYDDGNGNLFDPAKNNGYLDFQVLGSDFNQSVQEESTSTSTTDETTGITTTNNVNATITGSDIFIAFDKRLLALSKQCGFWIQLSTPSNGEEEEAYFEVPGMYFTSEGKILAKQFVLNAFDTYYQNRSLNISKCTGKAILHPFMSSSVSDFWGANCSSLGRVLVKNNQAMQQWYPDDVIKSDEFVNQGQINGFGTWRGSNRKQFKGQERGGIVAGHAQNKLIVFICQSDWFMTDYDLQLVRSTSAGLIVASADNIIGDPQQKKESMFGCEYADTGTIQFIEGDKNYVVWADSKKEAIALCDYRTAIDIADLGVKSYFSDKFNYQRNYNNSLDPATILSNLMELTVGVNPKYKEISFSFRKRKNSSTQVNDFVNTERETFTELNETFTFSIEQKQWARFETFVPEFYGMLQKSISGNEFISFVNGVPYLHNSKDVDTFNEFYGVSDSQVIDLSFYPKEERDLTYQCIIITSPVVKFFVDKIKTNHPNLYSYVAPFWVRKRQNKFYSTLLRNMGSYPSNQNDSPSMIVDRGGKIAGEYCRIRLVRDVTQLNSYSEIDHILMQHISTSGK